MISSLLFRTLEDEPSNEAKIRGLPDLKCGAVMQTEDEYIFLKRFHYGSNQQSRI